MIRATLRERFEAKFIPEPMSGCWIWTAWLSDGYGLIKNDGRTIIAHRLAYELYKGPIPDGLELDHLCRNRCCVNPDHLEPVTRQANILRGMGLCAENAKKTHCSNGHPYDEKNTYVRKRVSGGRACRTCGRAHGKRHYAKKIEAARTR